MERLIPLIACFLAGAALGCQAEAPAIQPAVAQVEAVAAAPAEPLKPRSEAARKAGVDWPTFLGPGGDSKSPETGILKDWPAAGLPIRWQKELGTSYGAPAISDGKLFQFDRIEDKARLYCLDAETGEELWRHEFSTDYQDLYGYNNGPRCSPIVDGDKVYAYGVEGRLICCRVADGKLLWEVDTTKDFGVVQNFFGVGSTPVIEGELLIVMIGGSPPEDQQLPPGALDRVTSNGTAIVAFDKNTGQVRYKIGDELASYASLKLATIGDRRWGFAFCRGGLVGFEPASGKIDFHYPWRAPILESVNASVPVVVGDEVFISETYGPGSTLLKVEPGKYSIVWQDEPRRRAKAMQTHWMTPIYVDGYLYGSSGRHTENAELRCIEWKTGKVMWSEPGMTRCSLLHIDGHFVCLGEYGQLTLVKVNPEKFEKVESIDHGDRSFGAGKGPLLNYPCWAAPIVSHGLLYIRGDDRLLCLELIP